MDERTYKRHTYKYIPDYGRSLWQLINQQPFARYQKRNQQIKEKNKERKKEWKKKDNKDSTVISSVLHIDKWNKVCVHIVAILIYWDHFVHFCLRIKEVASFNNKLKYKFNFGWAFLIATGQTIHHSK